MSPFARIRALFRRSNAKKLQRPSLHPLGRTGEARYSPQIRTRLRGNRDVVYAHRYDRISYNDYDKTRFYPAVVDALGAIIGPVSRANFHFSCARPDIADLAGELVGPRLRMLIHQLVRGGLSFGHQTAEIVWDVITDYTSTSGQSVQGCADIHYPFVYGVKAFRYFDPSDTMLQIFADTGEFAGIRQMVTAEDHEIPVIKLIHWVNDPEFDTLHGVPRTKPIVPWVDAAESVVDDMVLYSDRFAVPWTIGRHPAVTRADGDGNEISSVQDIHDIMESLGSAGYASLPSDIHMSADGTGSAVPKWDISIEQAPGEDRYVEKLRFLNDVIRLGLIVPEMASGSSPDSGTYNLGETQIDLFLSNVEGILDSIATAINEQLMRRWVDYNFGGESPDCHLVFEPVDIKVKHALLASLLQLIQSGQAITDSEGNQHEVDWAKLAEDSGIALHKVDPAGVGRGLKEQILQRLAGGAGAQQPYQQPPNGAELSEPTIERRMMNPQSLVVHPDMQFKSGATAEGNTRPGVITDEFDISKMTPLLAWQSPDGAIYVVDGHHRRQAAIDHNAGEIPVNLIKGVESFDIAKAMGVASNIRKATLGEYDESKHKRDKDGKFASKGEASDAPIEEHPEYSSDHVVGGVKPTGYGIVGPQFEQFTGDGRGAIDHLLKAQVGEVPGALENANTGPIDLVYGNAKFGLAHIEAKHPEVLDSLPEIIKGMTLQPPKEHNQESHILISDKYTAVVKKNFRGESKHWLLTAFEETKNASPE